MAGKPELGLGTYRAEQISDAVIVHADGETPTAGWTVWLQEAMIDVYPPEFTLYWEPPDGLAADVVTPFHVQADFFAEEPVRQVTIRDLHGAHDVAVKQAQ